MNENPITLKLGEGHQHTKMGIVELINIVYTGKIGSDTYSFAIVSPPISYNIYLRVGDEYRIQRNRKGTNPLLLKLVSVSDDGTSVSITLQS